MRQCYDKNVQGQNLRLGGYKIVIVWCHDITSRRQTLRGFTLIELLVVISIIALLLSIMVPSLQRAKESARRVVCKTQLHDLGIGIFSYANEFKGELIPPFTQRCSLPGRFNDPARWHLEDSDVTSFPQKLPYLLRTHIGNYMMHYGVSGKNWSCPSMQKQYRFMPTGVRNYLESGEDFWIWPANSVASYPEGYFIGYVNIMKLHDMVLTQPRNVRESPRKMTDSGNKHLLADLNVKWPSTPVLGNNVWQHWTSMSAHRGKEGMPAGGNRLYLNGSVEWIMPDRMGYLDQPLDRSEGKFDHAPANIRDYYW